MHYIKLSLFSFLFLGLHQIVVCQNHIIKTDGIELIFITEYEASWADYGSGADKNLSTWKPIVKQNGFKPLGYVAKEGYDKPLTAAVAVKGAKVSAPIDYKRIWGDWGSGADQDGSIWEPIPPVGYVALGTVVVKGYDKPSTSEVVCIHKSLVTTTTIGEVIWGDWGSGADNDVVLYKINTLNQSNDHSKVFITSGSFIGVSDYNKPTQSNLSYAFQVEVSQLDAFNSAEFTVSDADQSKWMTIYPELKKRTLKQITTPGTHHSDSRTLKPIWSPCNTLGNDFLAGFTTGLGLGIPSAIALTKAIAQNTSVKDQLEKGVRYLDMRACYAKDDKVFVTQHTVRGNPCNGLLSQVRDFMTHKAGANEIVFIEIALSGGQTSDLEINKKLVQLIKSYLDPWLYIRPAPSTTSANLNLAAFKLEEITSTGPKVIALFNSSDKGMNFEDDHILKDYKQYSQFWSYKREIEDIYHGTQNVNEMETNIQNTLDAVQNSSKLIKLQYILEWTSSSHSLKGLEKDLPKMMPTFLNKNLNKQINFIFVDFYSETEAYPYAIKINGTHAGADIPVAGKTYFMESKAHPGYVLDVSSSSKDNSAEILLWQKHNGINQKFKLLDKGNGYYLIQNINSEKAIDFGLENLIQWDPHAGVAQLVKLSSTGDGYYFIEPKHKQGQTVNAPTVNKNVSTAPKQDKPEQMFRFILAE